MSSVLFCDVFLKKLKKSLDTPFVPESEATPKKIKQLILRTIALMTSIKTEFILRCYSNGSQSHTHRLISYTQNRRKQLIVK